MNTNKKSETLRHVLVRTETTLQDPSAYMIEREPLQFLDDPGEEKSPGIRYYPHSVVGYDLPPRKKTYVNVLSVGPVIIIPFANAIAREGIRPAGYALQFDVAAYADDTEPAHGRVSLSKEGVFHFEEIKSA